jgi:hypothetical protein
MTKTFTTESTIYIGYDAAKCYFPSHIFAFALVAMCVCPRLDFQDTSC